MNINIIMKRTLKHSMSSSDHRDVIPRYAWTKQEDELLAKYAILYNERKWRLVAKAVTEASKIHVKTPKQCRERWHTRLNPKIKVVSWTEAEKEKLFELHKKTVNKWAEIAKDLPGRTDNSVKNYFSCKLRKLTRAIKNSILITSSTISSMETDHAAYLLTHLYSYYISPDRCENFIKLTQSNLSNRKIQGDSYIINAINNIPSFSSLYAKYVKSFISNLTIEQSQSILLKYPELKNFHMESHGIKKKKLVESNKTESNIEVVRDKNMDNLTTSKASVTTNELQFSLPKLASVEIYKHDLVTNDTISFNFSLYTDMILNQPKITKTESNLVV